MQRCTWASATDTLMCHYHDHEWGVPRHDDISLFEFLCLEGAQAGLSWRTVLIRRENYRRAFYHFRITDVASMSDHKLEKLLRESGIIGNRMKAYAIRDNARASLKVVAQYGSLDAYLWSFVAGQPKVNHWQQAQDVPASTAESERMSRALKQRGFRFVGPIICYALMQASGMVNDHLTTCFRHRELA